ncbi:MAG TPA: transcription elongation factor [Opitutaceae bacterium]|nr:transcription elongation factor [Opitutaceae bacterium]
MNKALIRDAILTQLRAELEQQTAAALLARDEAISEESRPENQYDMHSQEAAYLAEGQAKLANEISQNIAQYAALPVPDLPEQAAIAIGALVEIEGGGPLYFVGPRAGGLDVNVDGREVLVITPQSPLGRELMGKHAGDSFRLPGRGAPQRILSVS